MKYFVRIFVVAIVLVMSSVSYAAKYDIKKMTPEVQQALENRRARFDQLHEFKTKGVIGENNRGYVELLQNDSVAKSLVNDENRDRKLIYQTIAVQNGIEGQLNVIESVFAQVQREKAESGEKFQDEQGNWVQK